MLSLKSRSQLFIRPFSRIEWGHSWPNNTASTKPSRRIDCYRRRNASSVGGPSLPGQMGPLNEENQNAGKRDDSPEISRAFKWRPTLFKMFESAATTFMSIMVLG